MDHNTGGGHIVQLAWCGVWRPNLIPFVCTNKIGVIATELDDNI